MTETEAGKVVAVVNANWPDRAVGKPTAALWADMLADLSLDEVLGAVREHIAESPHFPTVADIRRRAGQRSADCPDVDRAIAEIQRAIGQVGIHGVPIPRFPRQALDMRRMGEIERRSLEAWLAANEDRLVDGEWRGGGYAPIAWSHPAVAAAVEAQGWKAICESDNPETWRAQVRGMYQSAATRAVKVENVGRLEAASAAKQLVGDAVKKLAAGGGGGR